MLHSVASPAAVPAQPQQAGCRQQTRLYAAVQMQGSRTECQQPAVSCSHLPPNTGHLARSSCSLCAGAPSVPTAPSTWPTMATAAGRASGSPCLATPATPPCTTVLWSPPTTGSPWSSPTPGMLLLWQRGRSAIHLLARRQGSFKGSSIQRPTRHLVLQLCPHFARSSQPARFLTARSLD